MADPSGFTESLVEEENRRKQNIKKRAVTQLKMSQSQDDSEDSEDAAEDPGDDDTTMTDPPSTGSFARKQSEKWPRLPEQQDVVRTPPINWSQYGIIGESLDKLHADQVAHHSDGLPAKIGLDGQVTNVQGGPRRTEPVSIAAPYAPLRDKIEKMGTRKSGKR